MASTGSKAAIVFIIIIIFIIVAIAAYYYAVDFEATKAVNSQVTTIPSCPTGVTMSTPKNPCVPARQSCATGIPITNSSGQTVCGTPSGGGSM